MFRAVLGLYTLSGVGTHQGGATSMGEGETRALITDTYDQPRTTGSNRIVSNGLDQSQYMSRIVLCRILFV
jgi:hypothetical protein